jgi:hypothetical protein
LCAPQATRARGAPESSAGRLALSWGSTDRSCIPGPSGRDREASGTRVRRGPATRRWSVRPRYPASRPDPLRRAGRTRRRTGVRDPRHPGGCGGPLAPRWSGRSISWLLWRQASQQRTVFPRLRRASSRSSAVARSSAPTESHPSNRNLGVSAASAGPGPRSSPCRRRQAQALSPPTPRRRWPGAFLLDPIPRRGFPGPLRSAFAVSHDLDGLPLSEPSAVFQTDALMEFVYRWKDPPRKVPGFRRPGGLRNRELSLLGTAPPPDRKPPKQLNVRSVFAEAKE